ncbi:BppU family phage baseplate upper protein [Brochothrix thermosphacta]|uniref:BppU family phage baseplate upper protein n=1 Tax=Brochothrix thermosphacta TaxID=2756 RepID=UPI000D78CAE5|nr:BppU family phage baseplate upper protein [Brochothrix thermosphacta]SPN76595.1 conserved hypothetical protein [Brochothrix thermosphacta]
MSITKITKTKMEITADYQKLSDLNVAFYNQDINTSILQFNVTRNDAPVPLGKVNVEGYIVLLAADGSRIQDAVEIVDEMEGIVQYTIPKEFLKHTGKVLGQVYIAVKGRDDTAVMRQISFDIKQDLLTGFSSSVKLEYIKTFDDLQTQIQQRVKAIEEAIANGEDYVAQMIATLDTGKKEIAATVTKANTDINKVATDAKNNVTVTADTATKNINSAATKATTDINKVSTDTTKKITDTSNAAVATVTAKGKEVTDEIANNSVVKTTDATNWQKQKITTDNGQFYYNLTDNKSDILASVISENGFKTGFAHFTVLNGLGNNRSFRFTSYYYPTNGYIHAVDTAGQSHIRVCNGGVWGSWNSIADTSVTQNFKITNDDGSAIVTTGYNLLNITDITSFDGYSESTINVPTGVNAAGYIKRKYKSGHVEVTYSPYNTNAVYRNSYNGVTKNWVGWEKLVTASELTAIKPVTIWQGAANGVSNTAYNLTKAINTFRVAMVTYKTASGNNKVQTFSVATDSSRMIISETNLSDDDASAAWLYECQIDASASTSFKIIKDNLFNIKTGVATTDTNTHTILKIEGVM